MNDLAAEIDVVDPVKNGSVAPGAAPRLQQHAQQAQILMRTTLAAFEIEQLHELAVRGHVLRLHQRVAQAHEVPLVPRIVQEILQQCRIEAHAVEFVGRRIALHQLGIKIQPGVGKRGAFRHAFLAPFVGDGDAPRGFRPQVGMTRGPGLVLVHIETLDLLGEQGLADAVLVDVRRRTRHEMRDGRGSAKLVGAEWQAARVEVVEREVSIGPHDDRFAAVETREQIVGQPFLHDGGEIVVRGGLREQVDGEDRFSRSRSTEHDAVLRAHGALLADKGGAADESAARAVVNGLRFLKIPGGRAGDGQQVRQIHIFDVEFEVVVVRPAPAGHAELPVVAHARRQRRLISLGSAEFQDGVLDGGELAGADVGIPVPDTHQEVHAVGHDLVGGETADAGPQLQQCGLQRGRDLAALETRDLALRGDPVLFDVSGLDVHHHLVIEDVQLREQPHHADVGELGQRFHDADALVKAVHLEGGRAHAVGRGIAVKAHVADRFGRVIDVFELQCFILEGAGVEVAVKGFEVFRVRHRGDAAAQAAELLTQRLLQLSLLAFGSLKQFLIILPAAAHGLALDFGGVVELQMLAAELVVANFFVVAVVAFLALPCGPAVLGQFFGLLPVALQLLAVVAVHAPGHLQPHLRTHHAQQYAQVVLQGHEPGRIGVFRVRHLDVVAFADRATALQAAVNDQVLIEIGVDEFGHASAFSFLRFSGGFLAHRVVHPGQRERLDLTW